MKNVHACFSVNSKKKNIAPGVWQIGRGEGIYDKARAISITTESQYLKYTH